MKEYQGKGRWKNEVVYKDIMSWETQHEIDFDDFNECDSGYCGL